MTTGTAGPDDSGTDVFAEPAPMFSLGHLREVVREHWELETPDPRPLDSERDLNVLIDGRFVLKVSNPAESADVVDMEVKGLAHVYAADPGLPIPATVASPSGGSIVHLRDDAGRDCLARLITFLPGTPVENRPLDIGLAEQIGATAARMSVALQGFFHPAAGRTLMWDIRRMPSVLADSGIEAGPLQKLAARVTPALEAAGTLPSGVQHADVTLTNVLAESDTVSAVIDFGDMHHTAAVCDLAATLTSVLRKVGGDDYGEYLTSSPPASSRAPMQPTPCTWRTRCSRDTAGAVRSFGASRSPVSRRTS
ncbi:phosphotransferase [Nonomuraea sp. K274]|uniref:Phosphotransferase n=1 Tax=Nonomuraea cypriaca TaxID=1187855 RepID=A0A931A555_9ACTN|nr:phosphotransferase [Nonomuraea cypriaca]MBF8184263.1 phosphotransferase [Nonomuraea cypriaca]